ncbi:MULTISPECIES: hypothetical protein [Halomonas]|uniref:hypothetical protein n=1 Tax=Halomonas TaxID=2745 RepID=UPI001C93E10D|nr:MULTISPECIES: hypothetical protein [Halomonas]MBY6207316.1 hypothetical protein [Halomonas sp. DP3Y7-2]MBY6229910.1 hypothetical protein [Halomonas sp. DP3Y7-1]MCA0917758.1 hypothetical protein [Halomonas denitrificans]
MIYNDEKYKKWNEYFTIQGLKDVYLQDSYVLKIDKGPDHISFFMDFVLMETHSKYINYHPGEQYCYRRGVIEFAVVEKVNKFYNSFMVFSDLSEEADMGNIDVFLWKGKRYILQGDWGELDVECERVMVYLYGS